MAYLRLYRTYAIIVDASTGTDAIESGMGGILTQIDTDQIPCNQLCIKTAHQT
jgi:hypothetical protein